MSLLTYDEAIKAILHHTSTLDIVRIPVAHSSRRFIAGDVYAAIDLPIFDNSQMDGYAVRSTDLLLVSPSSATVLTVTGTNAAGSQHSEIVQNGQAIKVFTGAPIPSGADAVVPIEDVTADRDGKFIVVTTPVKKAQFVRFKGEDVRAGDRVAQVGDLITPGRLALILSAGIGAVDVFRQPRVVVLTNGDELASSEISPEDLSPGQIYESNGYMLGELAKDAGADVVAIVNATDSLAELVQKIESALSEFAPDLIISSGGVSVGDRDFIRPMLMQLGEIVFWRAAIRPGKPILYGKIGPVHFLGLPGNPASSLVTFELFARPLLAKQQGSFTPVNIYWTILGTDFRHEPGRHSFVRAQTTITTHQGLVSIPAGGQGSHFVTSLANANSLIILPEDVAVVPAGSSARCFITGPLTSG
jgi:molybdopterin molybdotransferase